MAEKFTTNTIAEEIGTDPKTLRRFLRSQGSPVHPVGQGNRYAMTRAEARKVQRAFDTWRQHKAS